MLLAIDIGNTNIVLGVYKEKKLEAHWRLATDLQRMPDEYGILINNLFAQEALQNSEASACVIACVVPPLLPIFQEISRRHFHLEPLLVGPGIKTGVKILLDNPRELGADRIVNAIAVRHLHGAPAIVIDFGTATTFDVVSRDGEYLGGAIAPGIGISADALYRRTAQLPKIELVVPEKVIGKNTIASMQSGVLFGYISLVEGMVNRIEEELGEKAKVVATGGLAEVIAKNTPIIQVVDPFLTLEGLRLVYEMNR